MLGLALKLSLKFGMLKLDSLDFYPVSDFINILLASNKVINFLPRFCLILKGFIEEEELKY